MGFIYFIRNTVNTRVYIGQTTMPRYQKRWSRHRSDAKKYQEIKDGLRVAKKGAHGTCSKLYQGMYELGIDNFYMDPNEVEEWDNETLNILEPLYIEMFDCIENGYNQQVGGHNAPHSGETIAHLKVVNPKNMKTTFVQFRKHEELDDIEDMHIVYIKREGALGGLAINKHPLCNRKEFSLETYGTMDAAKTALIEYLEMIKARGTPDPVFVKKDPTLLEGIQTRGKKSFVIEKTINKVYYYETFSKKSKEENRQDAINYVNSLPAKIKK